MAQAKKLEVIPTPITPVDMLGTVIDRGGDINIDQLTKLIELNERYQQSEAQKTFNVAMSEFRSKVTSVKKTKEAFNYYYADLNEIVKTIQPVLKECNLSHSFRTKYDENGIHVTCVIKHVDGHEESTTLSGAPDVSGSKNSIQAIGSSVTYLSRYTLMAMLGLAAVDDDDGASADEKMPLELITPDQVKDIKSKIEKAGVTEDRITNVCKVNKIEEIPASEFKSVIKKLDLNITGKK